MNGATEPHLDWVPVNYDVALSVPIDIDVELKRLQSLREFNSLLKKPLDTRFCRLSALAARSCQAPMAYIGLVDMGKVWVIGRYGFDASASREYVRAYEVCAHTILRKTGLLAVNDVQENEAYRQTVPGDDVSFAACSAIIRSDGAKLGAICVLDTQPRPDGLTPAEEQSLKDVAGCIMDLMEASRTTSDNRRESPTCSRATRTNTNKETNTCNSWRVQQSVSLTRFYLNKLVGNNTVLSSLEIKHQTWLRSACDSANFIFASIFPNILAQSGVLPDKPLTDKLIVVNMSAFMQSIEFAMDAFPRQAHIGFKLHSNVPTTVELVELKVFRSCIAVLTSACERTPAGWIVFKVFVRQREANTQELVFECTDSGYDVDVEEYGDLFDPKASTDILGDEECISVDKRTGEIVKKTRRCATVPNELRGHAVHAIASYIGSIPGGDYGFRPRETQDFEPQGTGTGSIFWFSVRLTTPTTTRADSNPELAAYTSSHVIT